MAQDELDLHVEGLLRGDEAAFEAVYDLTSGLMASVANGMLGSHALAEEVVQDVYFRLAMNTGAIRKAEGRSVRAWLLRAVRNRCLDLRASAAQRMETTTAVMVEAPAPRSDVDELLDQDMSPGLRDALAELTEDQRTALVLTHVAGLSGFEVADIMGRNRAAVYSLLRRAERSTKKRLETDQSTAHEGAGA